MTKAIVFIDGKQVDYRKAAISVFDYTLHCGIGLFESILGVENRLILFDEHLDRMEKGIRQLDLRALKYNRQRITDIAYRAVASHPDRIKKVKIILTQGFSPLWPGNQPKPKSIIIIMGHRLQFKKQSLILSPMTLPSDNPLRGTKTLNYMNQWLSQRQATDAGYDQGIIINSEGYITETGSSNIFIAKNGKLYTPPLSSGCLPGITRGEVLKLSRENSIDCIEKRLSLDDLKHADEIFTTSSFKLVWPVVELKLKRTHKFPSGPIAKLLFTQMKKNFGA